MCLAECHARKAYSAPKSTYKEGGDKRTVDGKKSLEVVVEKSKNNPSPQKPNHAVSFETATAIFHLFSEGTRIPG